MNTEQKIDKILERLNDQNVQIATFITHQKQHRKEIDTHANEIDKLKTIKNKMLGIVIAISGGVSVVGVIIGIILKH